MLEGIGKIGNYLNLRNMKIDAHYRITTGQSLTQLKASLDHRQTMQVTAKPKSSSLSDKMKLSLIKDKLKQGRELSANEMKYLKENDAGLYRKAKNVAEAREELKRDLKNAKTRNEARSAVMRAQLKAADDAMSEIAALKNNAGGADVNIGNGYEAGSEVTGGSADFQASMAADAGEGNMSSTDMVEDNSEAVISDAEAKEILGNLLQSINEAVTEAEAAEKNAAAVDGEEQKQNGGTDDGKRTIYDIVDELLYKFKAIQNEWEEYIKGKEYKQMPENAGVSAPATDETALLDAVASYRSGQAGEISLLDLQR